MNIEASKFSPKEAFPFSLGDVLDQFGIPIKDNYGSRKVLSVEIEKSGMNLRVSFYKPEGITGETIYFDLQPLIDHRNAVSVRRTYSQPNGETTSDRKIYKFGDRIPPQGLVVPVKNGSIKAFEPTDTQQEKPLFVFRIIEGTMVRMSR